MLEIIELCQENNIKFSFTDRLCGALYIVEIKVLIMNKSISLECVLGVIDFIKTHICTETMLEVTV